MAERRTPLLLDANLCVLLVVGSTQLRYIARHKRLDGYDEGDFRIVRQRCAEAPQLLFCPNVLTETSNLLRQVADPMRKQVAGTLAAIVARSSERHIESRVAMDDPAYLGLGLTDAVLLMLAREGAALLTADLGLYLAATKAGHAATNYNHIRAQRRDYQ
jgi:hypothetical protein